MAEGKWKTRRVFQGPERAGYSTAHLARGSKLLWRKKPQRAVRSDGVVVDTPCLDRAPGVGQIDEPVFIQTGIPELAVEAFDQRVLDRLARLTRSPVIEVSTIWPMHSRQ